MIRPGSPLSALGARFFVRQNPTQLSKFLTNLYMITGKAFIAGFVRKIFFRCSAAAGSVPSTLAAKIERLIKIMADMGVLSPGKIFSTGAVDNSGAAVDMSPDCYADFNTLASCLTIVQRF